MIVKYRGIEDKVEFSTPEKELIDYLLDNDYKVSVKKRLRGRVVFATIDSKGFEMDFELQNLGYSRGGSVNTFKVTSNMEKRYRKAMETGKLNL